MVEFFYIIIEKILRIDKDEFIQIIKESVVIVFIASLIGFIVNIYHPRGYTFVSTSILKNKQVVMINSEEGKIKMDNGQAVFIDTRTTDEYNKHHILNAIHIPATPISQTVMRIKENSDLLQSPRELVIYCDGSSCGSSTILAKRLIDMGYSKHLYILEQGIPEWIKKNFPMGRDKGIDK